jgi:hypothetical protein
MKRTWFSFDRARADRADHGRLARLLIPILFLAGMSIATAQPAAAATCATKGHVYETANGFSVKYEDDPTFGFTDILANVPDDGRVYGHSIRLGGNGLKPSSTPFWQSFRPGSFTPIDTFNGSKTSNNCVSNEKRTQIFGISGDTFIVKANYGAGNSGAPISNQEHFRVIFI